MIRGRRAHGAALATLPTCAHLSPDSQARLHRAGSVPCKPKTLKMSAYGTFSLLRDPQGSCQHVWALPHTFATWQGCRENLLHPYHRALGRLQPVKAKPLRGCFASLDRFPAPSASVSFATPTEMERGVKGDEVVHFTLDALNRPNTHRRGRWIGFATCPCGLASERGFGQSPKGLFFVFEVVRVDVTVQKKVKKMCIFRIFATKNTANLANF